MIFSKTFGYALRGMLYIALVQYEKRYVQIEEVAQQLAVPRHFLSKVFKRLVQQELLASVKGPNGGYALTKDTLSTPLIHVEAITDGLDTFNNCVLRLRACNATNPCPMHFQMLAIKEPLRHLMETTTIASLLLPDKALFLKSIATYEFGMPLIKTETND